VNLFAWFRGFLSSMDQAANKDHTAEAQNSCQVSGIRCQVLGFYGHLVPGTGHLLFCSASHRLGGKSTNSCHSSVITSKPAIREQVKTGQWEAVRD